jgi:hypothetical protein
MRGLFYWGAHGGNSTNHREFGKATGRGCSISAPAAASVASADVAQLLSHLPATPGLAIAVLRWQKQ